ncbi:MAG: RHS repeat-associated core domain-containing protein, partial [Planctomycetota bacterium]
YQYDSKGRMTRISAFNARNSGGAPEEQKTYYIFGGDSIDNSRVSQIVYPDAASGVTENGTTHICTYSGTDCVALAYDRLGRKTSLTDQRGTVHAYDYDTSGRLQKDRVTTPGSGVDTTVQRIEWAYEGLSRIDTVTNYDAASGGSAVNGVKFHYDAWGNLANLYQNHISSAGTGDLSVGYTYADGASGNVAAYVRLSQITLPNSRNVYYNYPSTGIGAVLSRLDNIAHVASPDDSTKYSAYTYLGASTVVQLQYPAVKTGGVGSAMALSYGTGGSYSGFDAFGRVVDQKWTVNSTTPDEYQYGYDVNSNRLWRTNEPARSASKKLDEVYHNNSYASAYDGLDRLVHYRRGAITTVGTEKQIVSGDLAAKQQFTLEGVGNWKNWDVDNNGDNSWDLQQTRVHNAVNETGTIAGTGTNWVDPTHDAAGNMTLAPLPGDEGTAASALLFKYDAWNRVAEMWKDTNANGTIDAGTDTLVAKYRYDGLNHRVVKLLPAGAANHWKRTDYYYNGAWQVLEERYVPDVTGETTAATNAKYQYVWDTRYVDAPILRDEDTDTPANGTCNNTGDRRLYYLTDANMNVTAVAQGTLPDENGYEGKVVERYRYDAYGQPTAMVGEVDKDGNSTTATQWNALSSSLVCNEILFAGYRYDPETGMYHVRNRMYHPTLGRWVQRDPAGYVDGANLYESGVSSPPNRGDPLGLSVIFKASELAGIESYIKASMGEGLSSYKIQHNFTPGYCTASKGTMPGWIPSGGIQAEIVAEMVSSQRPMQLKDGLLEEWKKHVATRMAIVNAAKTATFGWGSGNNFALNPDRTWAGGTYADWQDMWANGSKYKIACLFAATAVMQKGIADSMGAADYNAMVGAGGNGLTSVSTNSAEDWIAGDWGYVLNNYGMYPGVTQDKNAFYNGGREGENIIFIGFDKYGMERSFWGQGFFGPKTQTLSQWMSAVAGWGGKWGGSYPKGKPRAELMPERSVPGRGLEN